MGLLGSMAELVDAPDSKSGHFGGVGSIPSTPTIFFEKYFNLFFVHLNLKYSLSTALMKKLRTLECREDTC